MPDTLIIPVRVFCSNKPYNDPLLRDGEPIYEVSGGPYHRRRGTLGELSSLTLSTLVIDEQHEVDWSCGALRPATHPSETGASDAS